MLIFKILLSPFVLNIMQLYNKLSAKERKHRIMVKVENIFGCDLSKKHFKIIE